ncbi:NAD(P)-dependent dehydrogenase, short-chain alcohol dehydrogenase family [Roseovarius nanhaiticus]|uniref:NAD(P)-dependent dehydrogenase, short-chain alcohol dehydrogenase family n=1 Tax=Roseovarius nanhaiticus TaxID=573024 RepID=A0A1N7F5M0_9RHOB|nr:SDR family oxidoreductase [Roseovarius nanhaiticus]SEK61258.1 NAD(P)-dependent dehydrogenase, short-chain alcohol dehydrogenase family [Roseovarius nanhaiticus]SIR95623.1 NAD(P)-dependent dehydrogenase, short-chain alcohol dehydrogenase family [Roseovarius nanhaiticus]
MARALVTGAGKRLGRAMAIELARQGFDIAVHYHSSQSEAEDVADEIRALGRTAVTLQADLLVEDLVTPLISDAANALGGPMTVLVNSASIFEHDTVASATRGSWDRHFESNLRAPFVLTQALAAQVPDPMNDENGEPLAQGLVVNMIDQRVRKLTPEFMSYTLAKMGLWAFTQTAAQALAPRVRVNGIGPGPTLRAARQSEEHFAAQRAATVLERGSNTSDITGALSYFLNAPSVTGQLLCIDGGQHLCWQTPDVIGVE